MDQTERDARLFGLLLEQEWGRLEDLPAEELTALHMDHGFARMRLNDPAFWEYAPETYAKLLRDQPGGVSRPTEQQIDELRRHYLWRY
jgi:hypothetical protein